ncbi:hypothetical protein D3C73_1374630 [compost metagenome]
MAFSPRLAYRALPRMCDLCITYSALSTWASPVSSWICASSPTTSEPLSRILTLPLSSPRFSAWYRLASSASACMLPWRMTTSPARVAICCSCWYLETLALM